MSRKILLRAGASLLVCAVGYASNEAFAQSTGTQTMEEEVIVVAQRRENIGGVMSKVEVPKARSTVTHEYFEVQTAGQSVVQDLNLVPGLNFTNNDPYGSSGGNLRIRGYDSARIALLEDGMPLNDSGNYAIFTNQQLDTEIVDHTDVNMGTTDVDAPTAAAVGGTINVVTKMPADHFGAAVGGAYGSYNYKRIFGEIDSGDIGGVGLSGFGTGSYQIYDKFKGPGNLEKKQFNARVYEHFHGDDFISIAAHFNQNRNAFYRNLTKAQATASNFQLDNDPFCSRVAGGAGAQVDGNCTNYYNVRINPSDTGNIRAQSKFTLTDKLTLTVDPNFQYVLANGGGYTVVSEQDARLKGNVGLGVDLNHDGDILDRVGLYTPNNTNTRRFGLNSSLIYHFTKTQLFRFAYSFDYALHRQTGQFSELDALGNPADVFGGISGADIKASDGTGADLRGRDRRSVAMLNQFAIDYDGKFWDDKIHLNIGVRAPFFKRNINNNCYTQASNQAATANNPGLGSTWCTTQTPNAINAQGLATFAASPGVLFVQPFGATKHYQKLLPNAGISFKPFGENHMIFINYAQGLAAPKTDNLYSLGVNTLVQPEKSEEYDVGYRLQTQRVLATFDVWRSDFSNYIVSSFDPINNGVGIDRNIGRVRFYGADVEAGASPIKNLTVYGNASYNHTTVKENLVTAIGGVPNAIRTIGNRLVETPTWTFGGRVAYSIAGFDVGMEGKYVTQRYSTDANDETTPAYAVFDGNVRYSLDQWGAQGTYVQFNVTNMFGKHYLGTISSTNNATGANARAPTYGVGAPRAFQVSVHAAF